MVSRPSVRPSHCKLDDTNCNKFRTNFVWFLSIILPLKVDDDDDDDEEEEQTIVRHKTRNTDGSNKDKLDSDLLIEPKSEYEDGNDEAVEDLTMADEELMEDLEQAGPSHGGEGSSQGKHQHFHATMPTMRCFRCIAHSV